MRKHIEESVEELRETAATFAGEEVRVEVWPEGSSHESKVVKLPPGGARRGARLLALERHLVRRQKVRARLLFFRAGLAEPDAVMPWPDADGPPERAPVCTAVVVRAPESAGEEEEKPGIKYSGECLEAIAGRLDEVGRRMTANEMVEALRGLHADSVVRHTLTGAVKKGRLTSATKPDRYGLGYGLPFWLPLEDEG